MTRFFNTNMQETFEEAAEYALIPINEYNGLQKVLRLYYDNKKGKDKQESRYKVLDQQLNNYHDSKSKFLAWNTTLSTPFCGDLEYEEVENLLQNDLEAILGRMSFSEALRLSSIEEKAYTDIRRLKSGSLPEDDYGIFESKLRYNGRYDQWELQLKSVKRLHMSLFLPDNDDY